MPDQPDRTTKSPFIWSQKIKWLDTQDDPLPFLAAEHFRSQRPQTGKEENKADNGPWKEINREQLLSSILNTKTETNPANTVAHGTWAKTVITTDAGIGKSLNLRWLVKEINRRRATHSFLAVLLKLGEFQAAEQSDVFSYLVFKLAKESEFDEPEIRLMLEQAITRGQLILVIDELDHVSASSREIAAVAEILENNHTWRNCRFVIGGRPHAVTGVWERFFEKRNWQFIQFLEFDEDQQKRFLTPEVFERIPEDSHDILQIPRVLSYVRELSLHRPDELKKLKTPSDVYYKSLWYLINEGLEKSEKAGQLGSRGREIPREDQIDLAFKILSAIAFHQITTPPPKKDWPEGSSNGLPNFNRVSGKNSLKNIYESVFESVRKRQYEESEFVSAFKADVDCIRAINEALEEGIVDSHQMKDILWRNRSLQEFFAGYWLACFYDGNSDGTLWDWIYIPAIQKTNEYYWVWRYAIEMDQEVCDPKSWLNTIRVLYRPGDGVGANTKRSGEMIYRSWWPLQDLADDEQHESAIEIRNGFLGEFEKILAGDQGVKRMETAKQFVSMFKKVEEGTFVMGSPDDDPDRYSDETPADGHEIQTIEEFQMNRYPTLNSWFRLFDPDHGLANDREYRGLFGGYEKSPTENHPAIYTIWFDSWVFCKWAYWDNQSCRLPQEPEWEYVCKAGTETPYWWGKDFDAVRCTANQYWQKGSTSKPEEHDRTSADPAHVNPWGFVDMSGNVWEWCEDHWREHYERQLIDYSPKIFRVLRGGSWLGVPWLTCSAIRIRTRPTHSYNDAGFRVVRAK